MQNNSYSYESEKYGGNSYEDIKTLFGLSESEFNLPHCFLKQIVPEKSF